MTLPGLLLVLVLRIPKLRECDHELHASRVEVGFLIECALGVLGFGVCGLFGGLGLQRIAGFGFEVWGFQGFGGPQGLGVLRV